MSVQSFQRSSQQDRFMSEQQFEAVVEAILAGKYSWACVLILQSAGYNPLHYIPYRTYNRLIKDNCLGKREKYRQDKAAQSEELSTTRSRDIHSQHLTNKIEDLGYLENVNKDEVKAFGGWRIQECFERLVGGLL